MVLRLTLLVKLLVSLLMTHPQVIGLKSKSTLDDLPQPGGLRQWKVDMREKVADAYPWDSEGALAWAKEIDKATCIEDLNSNPYPELEIQLAKAVKK